MSRGDGSRRSADDNDYDGGARGRTSPEDGVVWLGRRFLWWLVFGALCSITLRLLFLSDVNKRVYNHSPGPCRVLLHDGGSSAQWLWNDERLLFIATGLGRAYGETNASSAIFVYAIVEKSQYELRELKLDGVAPKWRSTWAPKALSGYVSKGRLTLYMLDVSNQMVHSFSYQPQKQTLVYRRSFGDSAFTNMHSLAVVGADRFFVTNTARWANIALRALETIVLPLSGSVLYYDGKLVRVVESGLAWPTGLSVDEKRSVLLVGSMLDESVHVFPLRADMTLGERTLSMQLLTSPDQITVDAEGHYWMAAHPVLHAYLLHVRDPSTAKRSPSQVLRVRLQSDMASWVVTETYASDGATVSAAGSAVFAHGQLTVGSCFGRLLHCDVLNPDIT